MRHAQTNPRADFSFAQGVLSHLHPGIRQTPQVSVLGRSRKASPELKRILWRSERLAVKRSIFYLVEGLAFNL